MPLGLTFLFSTGYENDATCQIPLSGRKKCLFIRCRDRTISTLQVTCWPSLYLIHFFQLKCLIPFNGKAQKQRNSELRQSWLFSIEATSLKAKKQYGQLFPMWLLEDFGFDYVTCVLNASKVPFRLFRTVNRQLRTRNTEHETRNLLPRNDAL